MGRYANCAHRFVFDVAAYNSGGKTVTALTMRWKGYRAIDTSDDDIISQKIMYKNSDDSTWTTDQSTLPTVNTAWSKNFTGSLPIGADNLVEFGTLFVGRRAAANITLIEWSDYAALDVTYSEGGVAHTVTLVEVFGALDSKTRAKTTHRAVTELFGFSDSKTRVKTAHREFVELLGALDARARVKTINRALVEKFGALDSKTRLKTVHRALTELLGALDAKARTKSVYRTITELFGGLDSRIRAKAINREIVERVGALDSKSRAKSIFRAFLEKLGLSDVLSKTTGAPVSARRWGYSVPFSIFRRIGLSGTTIRLQRESLGLRASLFDRKSLSRRARGKAVVSVSQPIKINVSSLLRRKTVGVHGISVVHVGKRSGAHGQLLRPAESSVKVVGKQGFGLVAEALGLLEATYTYIFVTDASSKSCDLCSRLNGMTFQGEDIERMFPYAVRVDYSLIMPMVHPNCKCELILLEIGA